MANRRRKKHPNDPYSHQAEETSVDNSSDIKPDFEVTHNAVIEDAVIEDAVIEEVDQLPVLHEPHPRVKAELIDTSDPLDDILSSIVENEEDAPVDEADSS